MNEPPRAEPAAALRQAYRELQQAGSGGCPDAETLAGLVLKDVPPETREALADHVVSCRRCSEDYQILSRTHSESHRSRRPFLAWAVAAALALFGAGALFVLRSPPVDETTRGAAKSEATTPADGITLPAPPEEFRWPAQAAAEGYRVKLFNPSGEGLWESERVKQNRVGLPPLQRSRMSAGQSYFWVVETEMPLEKMRLGPFRFSLR